MDGYEISRQKLPYDTVNPEIVAADTGNDATEYRDDSITVAGGYRYWVRAIAGTEVGSPATVVSPYISLLAPPPPSQPDPIPTNQATREAVLDEMYRLEAAVADAAAGCMLYETAHPFSGEGFSTYTTEPAGIQCLTMRHLVTDNCIIQDAVYTMDSDKYTVGSYATGQPAFLSSYKGSISLDRRSYFQREGQRSDSTRPLPVGKWDDTPLIKYLPWNNVARMDFNTPGHATGSFDYITGTFERSSSVDDDH